MSEKRLILNAEIEENLVLSMHPHYNRVRFTENVRITDADEKIVESYSWVAYDNGERCIFPMYGNSNYVSNFKTLLGAKRNFLRTYPEEELK